MKLRWALLGAVVAAVAVRFLVMPRRQELVRPVPEQGTWVPARPDQ